MKKGVERIDFASDEDVGEDDLAVHIAYPTEVEVVVVAS